MLSQRRKGGNGGKEGKRSRSKEVKLTTKLTQNNKQKI